MSKSVRSTHTYTLCITFKLLRFFLLLCMGQIPEYPGKRVNSFKFGTVLDCPGHMVTAHFYMC